MKQNDWKIVYSSYKGINKRTIQFLSKELGKFVIREPSIYRIHVLPCEKEGCEVSKNTVFVGLYNESESIPKYIAEDEVPQDGFLIKVVENPDDENGRFVLLTAYSEQELFYAAVSFIHDYIPLKVRDNWKMMQCARLFDDYPLPTGSYSEEPDHKTRSIFTWGHSFNDYRAYIDNMAILKFNELILWNDFIPVNIEDIIEYAHSYGIKVVLGYSWGWKEIGNTVNEITEESVEKVKELAIREYRENYSRVNCDGIYFQAFTERKEECVGGKLIARMVTDMVNEVAASLWEITPDLRIIFGLHASSVVNRLDIIAQVDDRMEIMWEDCGEFPYGYLTYPESEEKYNETIEFTKKILNLRGGKGVGLLFKGVMMLDWEKFVNQRGPFVMGENSPKTAQNDRELRAQGWRIFSAEWLGNGEYAERMLRVIKECKKGEIDIGIAGTFDGGIYLPVALCAQMYRNLDDNYAETMKKVARRSYISIGE